jgi:glycosyltransferase involved in cell wall biosynthesis
MSNVEVSFVGNWNPQVPQNNVKIIAPVNSITLAEIYEQQDVFLHAAVNDPCPNVVIEAMACGLPIIYSTSGGTPEIANGYGVPLSSGDYEKILEEIRKNYHNIVDKLEADQYKFDINTVVDEYLKIFKKLLDQKQVY